MDASKLTKKECATNLPEKAHPFSEYPGKHGAPLACLPRQPQVFSPITHLQLPSVAVFIPTKTAQTHCCTPVHLLFVPAYLQFSTVPSRGNRFERRCSVLTICSFAVRVGKAHWIWTPAFPAPKAAVVMIPQLHYVCKGHLRDRAAVLHGAQLSRFRKCGSCWEKDFKQRL